MNLRLVAASVAVLALSACSQSQQYTHDMQYPDSVLVQKYGVEHVIVGKAADSECTGRYGYGFRVNFQKNGKTYSGVACHDSGSVNWTLEIDAGSVLLNTDPTTVPQPAPPTTVTTQQ